MSTVLSDTETVLKQVAPSSAALQATEAVATTIADPSILNILADIELAKNLFSQVKAALATQSPESHNRILAILKAIF